MRDAEGAVRTVALLAVQLRGQETPDDEDRGLHRVPVPQGAVGKVLIGPPHAEPDAGRQDQPHGPAVDRGEIGPCPRPFGQRLQGGPDRHDQQHIGEKDERRVDRHPDAHQMGVHAPGRGLGKKLGRRHGERVPDQGAGEKCAGDAERTRSRPAGPVGQAVSEAERHDRQQQKRTLVAAPDIGKLQVKRKLRRAQEPDIFVTEMVGREVPGKADQSCARQNQCRPDGDPAPPLPKQGDQGADEAPRRAARAPPGVQAPQGPARPRMPPGRRRLDAVRAGQPLSEAAPRRSGPR